MTKPKMKEPEGDLLAAVAPKPASQEPVRKRQAVAKSEKPAPQTLPANIEPIRQTNLLAAVIQAAADPKCQPEKMHALLDARDRLMAQEARVAFVTAYIDMQEELPTIDAKGRIEIEAKRAGAKKQSTPYATYNEINRVTKPILKKHRFAMIMLPDVGPNGVGVLMRGQLAYVCDTPYGRMVHAEQCVITAPLETSGSKNNVQGVGSSLSYTKRYCAIALLNLVSHATEDRDDDAKAAGKRGADVEDQSVVLVTEKQLADLSAAIKDCGVGSDTFCSKFEIEQLSDLPAASYGEAMGACKRFKEAAAARRGESR